jgi:DnaJ-class molecular chaperone
VDIVTHWDQLSDGVLGAVLVCEACGGRGTTSPLQVGEGRRVICETCRGVGALHRAYRVVGRRIVVDDRGKLVIEGTGPAQTGEFDPTKTAVMPPQDISGRVRLLH